MENIQKRSAFFIKILLFWLSFNVKAADPQFTQFYAAPLFLNPAFAGSTECLRLGANYRNQWFLSDRPYATYLVSGDYNLRSSTRFNGGVGGYVLYDNLGAGSYNTFEFAPILSYEVKLNKKQRLRFGLQPSYHLKYGGFSGDLTFGNQFSNVIGYVGGASEEITQPSSLSFFDISSGAVWMSETAWLGLALHHMLRNPIMSDSKTDPVPMRISIQGGKKYALNLPETYITPAFNFKSQGANFQTDIGFYYQTGNLILGSWLRGMPFFSSKGSNIDAMCFLVGFQKNQYKIGYSYDLPLSKMISSFGTHELSFTYELCIISNKKPKPPMKIRFLPCPNL
jgi:type IX secretion system PorP/SprF family membrane protein